MSGSVLTGLGSVLTSAGQEGGGGLDDSWFNREALAHAALGYGLTESIAIPIGITESAIPYAATPPAEDASLEGGALRGSGTAWAMLTKATVYQNLRTSPFAASFQGILHPIVAAQASYFGITNAAGTGQVVIATDITRSATDFTMFGYNGAATAIQSLGAADVSLWTWRLVSDGTTVRVYRQPAAGGGQLNPVGSLLTAAANYPTNAASPGFFASSGANGQALYKCVYSFVGPS